MAYTEQQLMTALQNAHNAGDAESAKKIAQMIDAQRKSNPEPATAQPEPKPQSIWGTQNPWTAQIQSHEAGGDLAQKAYDAFKGNAEFPEAIGWNEYSDSLSFGPGMKTTAAKMFGNTEDLKESIKTNVPGISELITEDKNGNPYFIAPEGEFKGQKVYLNPPGADMGDVADFIGNAGLYALGGNLAQAKNVGAMGNALRMGASQGAADVTAQKLAGRDDINWGQTAMTGLTGGAFDMAGSGVNKLRNMGANRTKLTPQKQRAVDYADAEDLPIFYDDVAESAVARTAGQQVDQVPVIGGAKDRQAQNLAQRAHVKEVTKRFSLPDSDMDDLYQMTHEGMKNHMQRSKDIAQRKFNKVYEKLDEMGNFDVPTVKAEANKIIQEELSKGSAADQSIIKAMQSYLDVPEGNFSHWQSIRSDLSKMSREMTEKNTVKTAIKRVNKTLNSSLDDVAESSGNGAMKQEWRSANKFYKDAVKRYSDGALKKAVNDDNPEKILQILMRKGGADSTDSKFQANILFNAMDKKGKAAARSAMMEKAFKEAITETGDFSPAKYATMLENYSNRLGVMLSKQDKKVVDGLSAYMRATQKAGAYGLNTPTGQQAVPAIYGLTATAGLASNPGATALGGAGVIGLRKLFRTKKGRSYMLALSNYPEKSIPEDLLLDITRYLAVKPEEQ